MLPAVNASLNAASAAALITGLLMIRAKRTRLHIAAMLTACGFSVIFLVSYLIYHAHVGTTRFTGQGWHRPLYFSVLLSHTTLAVVVIPLVIRTVFLAAGGRFQQHRQLARVTFPIWLYVSVTGVAVYWMLYRWR